MKKNRDNINFKKYEKTFDCNKCGHNHGINECPAFGKKCRNRWLNNHFEIKCRNRDKNVNSMVVDTNCLSCEIR